MVAIVAFEFSLHDLGTHEGDHFIGIVFNLANLFPENLYELVLFSLQVMGLIFELSQ